MGVAPDPAISKSWSREVASPLASEVWVVKDLKPPSHRTKRYPTESTSSLTGRRYQVSASDLFPRFCFHE